MEPKSQTQGMEHYIWQGEGYRPFVEDGDWLVALMNWEKRFDLSGMGQVERHNETDEVFVLLEGRSILFVLVENEVQVFDMQPGSIYNVKRSTWHNVIGNREAKWLIVESRNTNRDNTDFHSLSERELMILREKFPEWLQALEKHVERG